jgi:hypothetical protein
MMTEGFKPLYPAMCVSLRYLHRCQHGTKFKSSNGFCSTLYLLLQATLGKQKISRKAAADTGEESEGSNEDADHSDDDDDDDDQHSQGDKVKL